MHTLIHCLVASSQVLGYYNRRGINPEAFLSEIKYIASDPDDKHFFNVTDEAALKDIVDALGERIFSLEGFQNSLEPHCIHLAHSKAAHKCIRQLKLRLSSTTTIIATSKQKYILSLLNENLINLDKSKINDGH